jgi:hypothetical protein
MHNCKQSEPQNFRLELPGDIILTVPDTKFPLWNGPYGEGTLTIYKAEMSGAGVIPDTVAFITVYVDPNATEDFLTFSWYKSDTPVSEILTDIQDKLLSQYAEATAAMVINAASNSSKGNTLH